MTREQVVAVAGARRAVEECFQAAKRPPMVLGVKPQRVSGEGPKAFIGSKDWLVGRQWCNWPSILLNKCRSAAAWRSPCARRRR